MRIDDIDRALISLSGSLEPAFDEATRAWAAALAEKGREHRVIRIVAGHDWNA